MSIKNNLKIIAGSVFTLAIILFASPLKTDAAIITDAGSMPISGATQWHSASTPAFSQPVQFQTVRNIRATSTNLRLLYLNNTSKYITFLASVRKNFAGTPEMVTVEGTTTIRMAPYSATTSDPLSFSVGTGDYVYDRSFFPTASSSQVFSSGFILSTYNPESISVSGSLNGSNAMAGYATTSTSRLLEISKTFEHDIAYESLGNYEFGAYAVLGIPTDPNLKFTNLVGDSKTADFTQDTAGAAKPWHMTGFGKKNGIPFQNLALPGDSLTFLVNPASGSPSGPYLLRRSLLDAFPANTVNHYGTNSVDNGAVATTSAALELSYISQLKTIIGANNYLYQVTIDPAARKTSTSSWTTITEADQSPAGDNNNGVATAKYFNNFIKTQKPSYIDGVIDISSSVTTANGYWLPNMTSDGIHQGNTGNNTQGAAFAAVWPIATTTQAISSVVATSTASTTATITWNTSSPASRFVNFGLLSTYTASTTEAATSSRATSHSVSLSNLRPCTKYNFQVDGYSTYYVRATSSNQSFFTIGCTGSAAVATSTDSNVITTASGGTFVFGTTTVTVPASFTSTSTSAVFQAKQLDQTAFVAVAGTPSGKTQAGTYVLNLTALTDATTTLSTFNQPISVTLAYTDSDIAGLDASSLKIYRYDAGTGWTMLDNCTRDSVAKTVTCTTTHFSDFGIFGDTADTNAPTVSMTAPSNSSIVSGNSVTLSANSTDNIGVVGVQFYRDSNIAIGSEDTTSGYGVTWDTTAVSDGSHTLFAVSRDAAGNYATSSSVSVTVDNTAPVRSGGSPTGTLSLNTSTTTVSLTTNENATCKYSTSSGIAYGSMTAFTTTGGTSHSVLISGLSNGGSYVYYAKCQDALGNVNATDYTVSFTVAADANAPVVSIITPANNDAVSGNSITISANATDDVSVSGVQFKVGTVNIGAEDTSSPYSVSWDSTAVADGAYSLIAVARDGVGNYATSSIVTVTVDNTAPVRSSGSPSTTLAAGTTSTTLSLTTDESATCKYSTSSGTSYGSMTAFTTTGGTSHSSTISGLSNGSSYTYYVKCQDGLGNTDASDYTISFDVAASTPVASEGGFSTETVITGGLTYVTKGGMTAVYGNGIPNTSPTSTSTATSTKASTIQTTNTTQTTVVTPVSVPTFVFTKNLTNGSVNVEVKNLQKLLNSLGFTVAKTGPGSKGNETTKFGPATRAALIKFQKAYSIKPAVGYFGPVTRKVLEHLSK